LPFWDGDAAADALAGDDVVFVLWEEGGDVGVGGVDDLVGVEGAAGGVDCEFTVCGWSNCYRGGVGLQIDLS
jgi:hypothetical protein